MTIQRVVLDTNVLVAAHRSHNVASFAILQALRAEEFVALASVPLLLEYEAVLKRPEHLQASGIQSADVDRFLDAFCLRVEPVDLHFLWRPQTRDPCDEMVLETALNGRADALITLNLEDFVAAKPFRMPVLAPAVFIRKLKEEQN